MTKQNSVEWIFERFESGDMYNAEDVEFIKHQALKMHKEEIITTYVQGWTERFSPTGTAKNYYTKTFGGNNE